MDTFELNKPNWYTLKAVKPNDFLNDKLTSDQYGKWYSVAFEGDATAFLWQTKTPPVEGEKYWGYLEKTSSGKAVKFKWDKQNTPTNLPNGEPTVYTKNEIEKQNSINRAVALNNATVITAAHISVGDHHRLDGMKELADEFYEWLKGTTPSERPATEPVRKSDEAIDPTLMDEFGNSDWASMAGETLDDDLSMGG